MCVGCRGAHKVAEANLDFDLGRRADPVARMNGAYTSGTTREASDRTATTRPTLLPLPLARASAGKEHPDDYPSDPHILRRVDMSPRLLSKYRSRS